MWSVLQFQGDMIRKNAWGRSKQSTENVSGGYKNSTVSGNKV